MSRIIDCHRWTRIPVVLAVLLVVGFGCARAQEAGLPSCEWCGADEAPVALAWNTTLADEAEPGQRLVLSGTVYSNDGEKPVSGVLLYLYHTNHQGLYLAADDAVGNGRRHGHLRGWVLTGGDGRYEVATIRPMPYPGRTEAAHIHITVKEPGKDEYWIDSVHFDDDPLLTPERRDRLRGLGGDGVVTLQQQGDGSFTAVRDIVLEP